LRTAARRMVTAIFDRFSDAEDAVSRLEAAGIPRDSIRLDPGTERDTDRDAIGSPDTLFLGDASVGFWDSLRDLFLPDVDRKTSAEGLCRSGYGRYLVSVSATDAEYERVLDILEGEGAIDIDERAESRRAEDALRERMIEMDERSEEAVTVLMGVKTDVDAEVNEITQAIAPEAVLGEVEATQPKPN
jgi:hypothetical protein